MSVAETLQRLSSKPGVLTTISIDRASRTLLSVKGSVSSLLAQVTDAPAAVAQRTQTVLGTVESASGMLPGDSATTAATEEDKLNEFVKMVWKYVNDTEHMIQGMDDEVRNPSTNILH